MSPAVAEPRGYRGFGYHRNTGVGVESMRFAALLAQKYQEAVSHPTLLRPKLEALEQLNAVFLECSENWDGDGATAILGTAFREAYKFISLLPSMLQMPEITPLPNGQIGLEWYVEKNHLLVVSVGGGRSVTYASLSGTPQAESGIVRFADSIPQEILLRLNRLYPR